jgi:hypothetical protein
MKYVPVEYLSLKLAVHDGANTGPDPEDTSDEAYLEATLPRNSERGGVTDIPP